MTTTSAAMTNTSSGGSKLLLQSSDSSFWCGISPKQANHYLKEPLNPLCRIWIYLLWCISLSLSCFVFSQTASAATEATLQYANPNNTAQLIDGPGAAADVADAEENPLPLAPVRQSLNDAWWTGPMLAASAATLPRGHILIEPYLYDVIGTHSNGFGSLTYALYGLTDKLTVGAIPTGGFNKISDGPSSSNIQPGDLPLQAQYRLTQFHPSSWVPTTALNIQESFPTGKYDRLGNRPSNGFGSGVHMTTVGLYSQTYFWLPNRRILRMRFDTTEAFSSNVNVEGVSVYGTAAGFRGHAKPGNSFLADPSWEYSLTQRWVLALDTTYRHNWNTRVTGYNVSTPNSLQTPSSVRMDSGSSEVFAFAPAVEYSWKPSIGVLLGLRVIPASHNTDASITPAVAINFVH
jgi:hypothetical protein